MQSQLPSWLQSSVDATKVSSRVTGIVVGASSAIILVATNFLHLNLTADNVTSFATSLGMLIGAIVFVKGFIIWGLSKIGK